MAIAEISPHVGLDDDRSDYPLAVPLAQYGFVAAAATLLLFGDFVASIAILSVFLLIGWSWRADILPVLPVAFAFIWLNIATGYLFNVVTGASGGETLDTYLPWAVTYALLGAFCVLAGLRVGFEAFSKAFSRSSEVRENYNQQKLLIIVVAFSFLGVVFEYSAREVWQAGSQLIRAATALSAVPVYLLAVSVFTTRRGYWLLAIAVALSIIPPILSGHARFLPIIFTVVIAMAFTFRPWRRTAAQRKQNFAVAVITIIVGAATLVFGAFWTDVLKSEWRMLIWAHYNGGIDLNLAGFEAVQTFFTLVTAQWENFSLYSGIESVVQRFSSGTAFFAHVIDRIPTVMPHENGLLLGEAIQNLVPRVLFPDKPVLQTDSWRVIVYAGQAASLTASIGLGYTPEFFIDFGVPGIVALSFGFGFLLSTCLAVLSVAARNREIFGAVMGILVFASIAAVQGTFVKLLATLLNATVVFAVILFVLGPVLIRFVRK